MYNYHEWKDIKELDNYGSEFEYNAFVLLIDDGTDCGWTDMVYLKSNIPEKTLRFFCVPYDNEDPYVN